MSLKNHSFYSFYRYKSLLLCCLLTIIVAKVNAQEGPFLRFSLGPGVLTEYTSINESGFTYAAKNHAIGWGFKDKYAVYYSEFGAFTKKDIGEEYQFINLDAYGLGLFVFLDNCHTHRKAPLNLQKNSQVKAFVYIPRHF